MEVVGSTRLGRSSTRYGPATVFTGPVRKWKKRWVEIASPNPPTPQNSSPHLLLYKWMPTNNGTSNADKDDSASSPSEEPPRRKFRYVPIVAVEEDHKKEDSSDADEEGRLNEAMSESSPEGNSGDDDNKKNPSRTLAKRKGSSVKREASETSLDLNLGLKAGSKSSDNEHGADSRMFE